VVWKKRANARHDVIAVVADGKLVGHPVANDVPVE